MPPFPISLTFDEASLRKPDAAEFRQRLLDLVAEFEARKADGPVDRPKPDDEARAFIQYANSRGEAIRIIANRPGSGLVDEYDDKLREAAYADTDRPVFVPSSVLLNSVPSGRWILV